MCCSGSLPWCPHSMDKELNPGLWSGWLKPTSWLQHGLHRVHPNAIIRRQSQLARDSHTRCEPLNWTCNDPWTCKDHSLAWLSYLFFPKLKLTCSSSPVYWVKHTHRVLRTGLFPGYEICLQCHLITQPFPITGQPWHLWFSSPTPGMNHRPQRKNKFR